MEKKHNNSRFSFPSDVCEKIHKAAAAVSPLRLISNSPAVTSPASPTPPVKIDDTQFKLTSPKHLKSQEFGPRHRQAAETKEFAEVAPINRDFSGQQPDDQKNREVAGRVSSKVEPPQSKSAELHLEDTFSEYINNAKNRLRTSSNVGGGDGQKKAAPQSIAPVKDKFSEFIQRAKIKLRTTSSIGGGGGRSSSFK